jgi:hypothetical protein
MFIVVKTIIIYNVARGGKVGNERGAVDYGVANFGEVVGWYFRSETNPDTFLTVE